ncbi:MAG: 23S ribosomal RNA methyltransferase Erm, partial [Proteobacteria bacterium]|nr:23S ribosomal RNA methyltransferase Erm [Pseudomonadota bacterium]
MIYSHSQNFLIKKDLVENLIKKANFNLKDTVIDIGAGNGIITECLLNKVSKIYSFEIDEKYQIILTAKFKNHENVSIIGEDFLNFNLQNIKNPLQTFSNIPFNQTTKITKKILIDSNQFEKVFLIMQKQSAERLLGIKEGLLLSLLVLNKYEGKIIHEFKYSDFKPVSRVRS